MDMALTVCLHRQSSQQSCEAGTIINPIHMRMLRQSKLSDLLMVTQITSDQIMNQDKQRASMFMAALFTIIKIQK